MGDIRRGFLKGLKLENPITDFIFREFSYLVYGEENFTKLEEFRNRKLKVVPLLSKERKLLKLYNFTQTKSILPIDAIIMAGGIGSRLRPLTIHTPKPLLKVGGKEIISYNFDRLAQYGISNQFVTVNHLADQIIDFCDRYNNEINFTIIREKEFFGTAGSVALIDPQLFKNEVILLMNSDLLTNIDYEDLYKTFLEDKADMLVASIPYNVNLPYAIFDEEERRVRAFKEKPNFTYFANAGIYLIKKELIDLIPRDKVFNATDFMEAIISADKKLIHYPIRQYWLDIGKHEDFDKAQIDIAHINWE